VRSRCLRWGGQVSLCLAALLPLPGTAQTIEGRVLDAVTDRPVGTARVSLLDALNRRIDTALTDSDGRFRLRAREGGVHRLEADRIGYGAQRTDTFTVAHGGTTQRDVRLQLEAITLEGVTARVYPGALLHEATLSGALARRARSPSVGGNRVLVRGDPELDEAPRIRSLLPVWLPRATCPNVNERRRPMPFVIIDARPTGWMGPDGADLILDMSVLDVEAVEIYRDVTSIPMSFRPEVLPRVVRHCGFIAVWTRGAPR
jgi:hypothetical protein